MQPTIYIPSRLIKRLLPPLPDSRSPAEAVVTLSTSKVGRMDFCCCAQS